MDKKNIFGEIINNENSVGANGCWPDNNDIKIKLNRFGLIVDEELKNTENIRCQKNPFCLSNLKKLLV